ncbi:hypothetical protein TIFTF001_027263 [Ficus carica]|uniref:Uncharacterized protein n=1 Tax=Ficus carica TaxID=3494 RepID=A0AA88DN25_FICCA|nr:hypothetical protein TIFTF001_027263 [Ficus carica]
MFKNKLRKSFQVRWQASCLVSYRPATRAGLVHGFSWIGLVAPTTPWLRATVRTLMLIVLAERKLTTYVYAVVLVLISLCNGSRLKQACVLKVLGFESTFGAAFRHFIGEVLALLSNGSRFPSYLKDLGFLFPDLLSGFDTVPVGLGKGILEL